MHKILGQLHFLMSSVVVLRNTSNLTSTCCNAKKIGIPSPSQDEQKEHLK